MGCIDKHPVLICKPVQKALRFYTARWQYWTKMRGAEANKSARIGNCPRYLLKIRVQKARAAHAAYERWLKDEYHWQRWLPDKFARVGACETGYGKRPGSWTWDSGSYVSFAGIYRAAYAQFAHAIGLRSWDETRSQLGRYPTPHEQYLVADAIQRRFSWSAWGCGGA